MKASIVTTAAFLLVVTSAQPLLKRQVNPSDLSTAAQNWQSDTGAVSGFLNAAQGFVDNGDGAGFTAAAGSALPSEKDELTWKAVLDAQLCQTGDTNFDPQCLIDIGNANTVLVTDGTFQQVVNLLQDMTTNRLVAETDVNTINFGSEIVGGRCGSVLPAITTYLSYAAAELCTYYGDCSLNGIAAMAPTACSS